MHELAHSVLNLRTSRFGALYHLWQTIGVLAGSGMRFDVGHSKIDVACCLEQKDKGCSRPMQPDIFAMSSQSEHSPSLGGGKLQDPCLSTSSGAIGST